MSYHSNADFCLYLTSFKNSEYAVTPRQARSATIILTLAVILIPFADRSQGLGLGYLWRPVVLPPTLQIAKCRVYRKDKMTRVHGWEWECVCRRHTEFLGSCWCVTHKNAGSWVFGCVTVNVSYILTDLIGGTQMYTMCVET